MPLRRARQAAEAAGQAGPGADPGLPRRRRPEGGRAGRRDRRRLAAVHGRPGRTPDTLFEPLRPRAREGRPHAARTSTSRPCTAMAVETTSTRRATPCARGWPSTSARWARKREELLRRAGRARRPRRRGPRVPGGVPGRRPRGRRRPRSRAELIDAMALATTPDGAAPSAWPRSRRSASTRCSACRAAPTGRRSCARWPRSAGAARLRAPPGARPTASPAPRSRARSRSATTPRGCATRLREFTRVQVFGEVFGFKAGRAPRVVRAARRRRRAAVLDVARRLGRARHRRRSPTARRSSPPAAATTTPARAPPRRSSPSRSPTLRLAGEGDLLAQVERLRRTLHAEGLTEPQKRLARPALPRTIGVVTGEGGKARDDVLAGLRRRGWGGPASCGRSRPCRTATPPRAITRALQDLAACAEVEVIVVARGGGSLADLFAFCDETLCRTVAMLRVPVISSVGHHTDRTLIDDVAAVACSTPTHAAEAAVPVDCAAARAALRAQAARLERQSRRAIVDARAHARPALARARPPRRPPPRAAAPAAARAARQQRPRRRRGRGARTAAAAPRSSATRGPDRDRARRLDTLAARARRARPAAHPRARLRTRRGARGRAGHERRRRPPPGRSCRCACATARVRVRPDRDVP